MTILVPFGPLWSVDKPATFGHFWSKIDHFWAIPSHERSSPEWKKGSSPHLLCVACLWNPKYSRLEYKYGRNLWKMSKIGQNEKMAVFAHLSRPWSIGWVALSFLVRSFVRSFVRPAMVTSDQISTFLKYKQAYKPWLAQFHLKPSSTKLYWPSTTKYQPVPPHIDPAPPNIDQNCLLLTQYYNVSSSSASYWPNKHQVSTHTALYWPSTTKYQHVQPHTDPAPPITNLYRLLLTKYRHISTSSSPYWPSTTKYEPVPPHTGPVPPVLWYVEIFKCQTFLGRPEISTVVR